MAVGYREYLLNQIPALRRQQQQPLPVQIPPPAMTVNDRARVLPQYRAPISAPMTIPVATGVGQPPQTGYGGTTPGTIPASPEDAQQKMRIMDEIIARLQAGHAQTVSSTAPPPYNVSGALGENRTGLPQLQPTAYGEPYGPTSGDPTAVAPPRGSLAQDIAGTINRGAEAVVTTPIKAVVNYVPYGNKILDALNAAYEWNAGRIGGDMYDVASGTKEAADWPIYNVDVGAADWADGNKDKVKAIYEIGLDLNGDGVADLKGGDAVYMAYITEQHPGFIDKMVTQLGIDPLFAASLVVPIVGTVREGAAAGAETAAIRKGAAAAAGTADTANTVKLAILRSIEKATAGVEKAGEIANKIQEAPLTVPAWGIRKGLGIARQTGGRVGRTIGWLAEPASRTALRTAENTAADTADIALRAGKIPTYTTKGGVKLTPDALPERSVTNPPDFEVGPDGVVRPRGGGIPPEGTVPRETAKPSGRQRTLPTEGMTREQLNKAIKDPNNPISQLTPIPGGKRLIDQVWDSTADNPEAWARFEADYGPKAEAYKARGAVVESKYYDDFVHKQADQVIGGVEHVVDDLAPSVIKEFGSLPGEIESLGRKQATTKSGKASYRDENLTYLYQRYVYTTSEKDAARVLETLRKRPELVNAPWSADALQRIIEARGRLNELRPVVSPPAPGTIGFLPPGSQEAQALLAKVDELTNRILGEQTPRIPGEPNFAANDLGASERFQLANEIAIQEARGELPARTAEQLAKPVRIIQVKATSKGLDPRGQWRPGTEREVAAWAKANKITIPEHGNFTGDLVTIQETHQIDILNRIVRNHPEMTPGELSDQFVKEIASASGLRPTIRQKGALRTIFSHINAVGRSIAISNPLSTLRGSLSDAASDGLRAAMEGHLGAGVLAMSPVDYIKLQRGIPRPAQLLAEQYGKKLPHEIHVKTGRTEIEQTGRTATNKAVSGLLKQEEGSAGDRAIGILTGIVDSRTGRDIRNANDNVRREGVFYSEVEKREGKVGRDFRERARAYGEQHGILASSVDAYLDPLGKRTTAQAVREVMTELGHDALLPTDQAVNFGDRLARDWQHATDMMWQAADAEQRRVFFTYERTNLDQTMGNFVFFHYWMTRAVPAYAKIALRNPEIAASWIRAWKEVERRAEADGQPDSLLGYLRVMGSMTGFYGSVNPWNVILPIADLRPDLTAQGKWDKATQFLFVSPAVNAAVSVMGLDASAIDPFSLYATRNMAMAIVNEVRAHTGRAPYLTDPYEQLVRGGFEFVNDFVTKVGIPGSRQQDFTNPAVFTQGTIRYVVATLIEDQTGIPKEQWGPDQKELWRKTVADGESGIENPLYQEAFQKWADANLKGRVANSIIPGGVRVNYGPKDLNAQDTTQQGKDIKTLLKSGDPVDAKLTIQADEYYNLGSARQQALFKGHGDIAHAEVIGLDNGQVVTIDGQEYTRTQLAALDDATRKDLANDWVAQYNGVDELKQYNALRDKFVTDNPEFGSFKEYQNTVYNYVGGPHEFRLNRAAGNPNFKKEMNQYRDSLLGKGSSAGTIDAELDHWATTIAAYKAAQGVKDYLYDAPPLDTGDQSTVDAILRSGGGASDGGSKTAAKPKKTTAEKVQADIDAYTKDLQVAQDLMTGYGIEPSAIDSNNPYTNTTLGNIFGDLIPTKSKLQRTYETWRDIQIRHGLDSSVEAFGKYLDELNQSDQVAA